MDERTSNILRGWQLEADNAHFPNVTVRLIHLELVLRWAADAQLREQQAKAEGQLQVLRFVSARMPERDTKRNFMHPCCRFNLTEVIRTFPLERAPKLRR